MARAVLYGLPLILIGVGYWYVQQGKFQIKQWEDLDYEGMESVKLFQEFLSIDTSIHGSELEGAEFLARHLEAAGIETHILRMGEKNANLWAILEGEDPNAIVLHNHIDVDPIKRRDEWRFDPYGGVIEMPWIYGRGAFDMKSVTIAQLMSMLDLKRSGVPLRKSVMFLATGTEETESWLGTRWLLKNRPELFDRVDSIITEGGAVEALTIDEVNYWGTEFLQKRYIEIRACHGSLQRLMDLREDLEGRKEDVGRPRVTAPARPFLEDYATTRILGSFRQMMEDLDGLTKSEDFVDMPRHIKAMMRDELWAFPVEKNPGGGYIMRVVLHLLPGTDTEEALHRFVPEWITHGVSLDIDIPHEDAIASPLDHPLFVGIHEYMAEALPDYKAGAYFVPHSATDARFFREAGFPTYGYSPFLILSTDTYQMTGPNERMAIPAFVKGVELHQGMVRHLVTQ